jgi:hypothetical protein
MWPATRYPTRPSSVRPSLPAAGCPAGGFAAAGGYQYSAPLTTDGLDRVPEASPGDQPFALRDRYGALTLSGGYGVASSPDNETLYVMNYNGISAVRRVNGVYVSVGFADNSGPLTNGLTRVGDRLYASGSGNFAEFPIDADGLPGSNSRLFDRSLGSDTRNIAFLNNTLFVRGPGRLNGYDVTNGLVPSRPPPRSA